jgi:acetyltransferase-like isoleucine patch superfamily enzyme
LIQKESFVVDVKVPHPGFVRDFLFRVLRRLGRRRNAFVFNPWRREHPRQSKALRLLLLPFTKVGIWAGFRNVDYSYVHGDLGRLHVGDRCSLMDTTFNVVSGDVYIGDDTLFSHGCLVLTGQHRFFEGRRASLDPSSPFPEVPSDGRDITIGRGCFIGANATILGGVTIGDDVIVAAGAVVTKDVPNSSFVAGVPAVLVHRHPVSGDAPH